MQALLGFVLPLIICWGILWLIVYGMLVRRLLRTALQHPQYELRSPTILPDYLKPLFQFPIERLQSLGFEGLTVLEVRSLVYSEGEIQGLLLYQPQYQTYAQITPRRLADPRDWFEVSFYTFFADGTLLLTLNAQAHGVVAQIPKTILVDGYVPELDSQWQLHLSRLEQALTTHTIQPLDPPEFLSALTQHYRVYLETLVQQRQLLPVSGSDRFRLQVLTALKTGLQVLRGNSKLRPLNRQRQQLAKLDPSRQVELPIELEIEAFQRMQRLEQGSVPRRTRERLVLPVTLVLFILSFVQYFGWDWSGLLIFVGAIAFHEAGHYGMMRLCGYRDTSVFFLPFLGAAAVGQKAEATLSEKIAVLLAGPLPGFFVGTGLLGWRFWGDGPSLALEAGMILIGLNWFNLLPIYPLDGGKIAHLLLFSRSPWADAFFRGVAIVALLVLGVWAPIFIGVALVIALSIPLGLRSARVRMALRRQLKQPLEQQAPADSPAVLQQIYQALKQQGYDQLPFMQRYALVKELWHAQRELLAHWPLRLGWVVAYGATLLGPIAAGAIVAQQFMPLSHAEQQSQRAHWIKRRQAQHLTLNQQVQQLNQQIKRNPKDLQAYHKRAMLYQTLGQYPQAIADYTAILAQDDRNLAAYLARSGAYRTQNNGRAALADLSQVLKLSPNYQPGYFARSDFYLTQNQYTLALADANQLIQLNPKNPEAFYLRSDIRQQMGDEAGSQADRQWGDRLAEDWPP